MLLKARRASPPPGLSLGTCKTEKGALWVEDSVCRSLPLQPGNCKCQHHGEISILTFLSEALDPWFPIPQKLSTFWSVVSQPTWGFQFINPSRTRVLLPHKMCCGYSLFFLFMGEFILLSVCLIDWMFIIQKNSLTVSPALRLGFLFGWLVGLLLVCFCVVVLVCLRKISTTNQPS